MNAYEDKVILIQSHIRGFLERKKFFSSIASVKSPIYVGRCKLKDAADKTKGFWRLQHCLSKDDLTKDVGRIYFIVSNGKIMKIGKSECRGGIKSTFQFYQSGMGGRPSVRTFGIHLLIRNELLANKIVDVYMIEPQLIECTIKGLWKDKIVHISPSMHEMEDLCRMQYKQKNKRFPDWNFQENGEKWPQEIYESFHALLGKQNNDMAFRESEGDI
jgi:IQ calmodulin-binding motif